VDTFEHYRLLRDDQGNYIELGHGGMGVTYKAFDTSLQCHVALKVIAASFLGSSTAEERFVREARSAAQLRHRNVASVFHLGKRDESYYYAMELIDGETVEELVTRDGPLDCLLALEIAEQVACALIAAEKRQLVHRDIKPSNLMLVRESDGDVLVKVIDFGLVKSAVAQNASMTGLTAGGFVGTPYFASPEQLEQRDEDLRSDIYSLGITLWYMLTGKPTFSGSLASVIAQHLDKSPPFETLALYPSAVVALLRRMLEKDVALRLQSPSDLRSELKRCIVGLRGAALSARDVPPDKGYKTVELRSSRGLSSQPAVGSILKGRYRLIEDLSASQPGSVFHAEDEKLKQRVALRILHGDSAAFSAATQEVARAQDATHPNFVKVLALERERDFGFIVFEWMEGFSLMDLVRARRELSLREALDIVSQLAAAADASTKLGLKPDISLAGVFVQFPEGLEPSSTEVLLNCPIDEWPAWLVKTHVVARAHELDPAATIAPSQVGSLDEKSAMVSRLAALTYGLLGGDPKNFIPLARLDWETTTVLRRGLSSDHGFPSATDFFKALNDAHAPDRRPVRSVAPASESLTPRMEPSALLPAEEDTAMPSSAGPGARRWPRVAAAIVVIAALAGGAALAWKSLQLHSKVTQMPPLAAPPKGTSNSAAVTLSPPRPGKPWTNSLGLSFVPLGEIHMAVFETRVRDFEAFVQATRYDAEGGMNSVIKQDGFARRNLSWKSPGFPQTPDDPVVGVCWEDADQFCAWLTKKERADGSISAFQRYRLPTDREWSQAVGLPHEGGLTPEERSGRLRVYPWGSSMPPPVDAGNYAGEESRQDAPASWSVLKSYRDSFSRTAPVQATSASEVGVHGLGGNVWEWCLDRFNRATNWRILRGGSWATSRPEEMLSSYRRGYDPLFRMDDVGFRLVIAPQGSE
jgi:serine/threonine protein kinase/formylglycine-generating enzyme required for sulfatase activity